jgi:hypothetical protein
LKLLACVLRPLDALLRGKRAYGFG